MAEPKLKLMNFVAASQTDAEIESVPQTEQKQEVYDDRPLYEILKENADNKDAEFNDRFKHRLFSCHYNTLSSLLLQAATANPPNDVVCWIDFASGGQYISGPPKALDEDETEFLDALEMYRKQQEQEAADAEARELTNFHTAIASRTVITEDVKPLTTITLQSEAPKSGKRSQPKPALPISIKIKSQPKKARLDSSPAIVQEQTLPANEKVGDSNLLGLVAYSDESDDE